MHLLLSWSETADVSNLSLPCINFSVKPNIFFSFSSRFLQRTQNSFSFSENCGQFHFSFHFLIVLGFGRELELEVMICVLSLSIFLFKNTKIKLKQIFFHQDKPSIVELNKKHLMNKNLVDLQRNYEKHMEIIVKETIKTYFTNVICCSRLQI